MAEWSYVGQSFGVVDVKGKKVEVETYSVDGKLLKMVSFFLMRIYSFGSFFDEFVSKS
ncbi:MAG TPA: hypothetical protein P5262_02550 [Candidatus Moranbacteria bacterium]|nr:hypothetical protein [Candidatus Moranbacteria bacterium]